MNYSAETIIQQLQLEPLAFEGGYFRRTYFSEDSVESKHLPERYGHYDSKRLGSAIYFLLTPDTHSKIHRLPTDEIFHFYLGDPVEMLQLDEQGSGEIVLLGNDILNGQSPQIIVPKGTWQGSRLRPGGDFALLGTTMAPAFDFEDFESPSDLGRFVAKYPKQFHEIIRALA